MIKYADAVVDLAFGDSGKGKVSSYLASSKDYSHVVRFSGSNNAGHTIYIGGKKIVTHSIPVGVLHGVKSIIGPGCVLNVDHFFNELNEIEQAGIKTSGLVFISENTHIITNEHLEEDRKDTKIGTTKRGNGPAYRDKYDRKGVRASEVSDLKPYLTDIYSEFYSQDKASILFEGAQGFYLDVDWGDYPYVTSSHCTVGSAIMNGVPPQKIRKIYGVVKAYETYVGAKTFEPNDPIFNQIRELGAEYGATTGRPRQCNWLNLDGLIKAANINGVTDLIVNKVDILRQLDCWNLYHKNNLINFQSEREMYHYISLNLPQQIQNIYWSDNPNDIGKVGFPAILRTVTEAGA
jgi:adenylosuccinate synthase